ATCAPPADSTQNCPGMPVPGMNVPLALEGSTVLMTPALATCARVSAKAAKKRRFMTTCLFPLRELPDVKGWTMPATARYNGLPWYFYYQRIGTLLRANQ